MKPRILFAACNPWDSGFELPVMSALKNLGHEVEACDATFKPFGSRLLFRICRRLFKSKSPYLWDKLVQISSWFTQRRVLSAAKLFRPDVFLAIKAKEVKIETIYKLRNMGIVTANWYMEGIWNQSLFILAPAYDHFFVMDEYIVSLLRNQGVKSIHYMPHGTRISYNKLSEEQLERNFDVSFIGWHDLFREEGLKSLSNLDVNIWGPAEWEKTALNRFYRGRVYGPGLDDVYRHSKIVINFHHPTETSNGTNLRDFESTSNGALLISDYKPTLADLFVENKEIIFYRDIKELPDLVSYYLKNEKERSAIAKAGQTAVFTNHTIESRVKDMMKIIESSVNIGKHDK